MNRSCKSRRGFTLVELLVVIGIIAVLIAILLPVIGRARRQANTTACMATLRMIGQTLAIYGTENKGSMPYGFYRSDAVVVNGENNIDEADPNASLYIWWSVLRSYQRRGTNSDNGAFNSGVSTSSRGMRGMTCPNALGVPGTITYTVNMIVMPDLAYESLPFNRALSNPPPLTPIPPAKVQRLYSDNILMWDVTEVNGTGPSYGSQYVVGYEIDGGSFLSTKIPPNRYRQIADDPNYIPIGDPLRNDVPILPGSNREATVGVNDGQAGNIRWRHGNQDAANFLFADGTVRTLKMTTGTFGQANFKGEALHKYFRIKTPPGFNKRRG